MKSWGRKDLDTPGTRIENVNVNEIEKLKHALADLDPDKDE